jgi:hypothetical protein
VYILNYHPLDKLELVIPRMDRFNWITGREGSYFNVVGLPYLWFIFNGVS